MSRISAGYGLALSLSLLFHSFGAFAAEPPEPAVASDGTRQMVERLQRLDAQRQVASGWNAVLALEAMENEPPPDDPEARARWEFEKAVWALLAGDAARAVRELEALAASPAAEAFPDQELDATRAIAWLRLGEVENCIDHHNSSSCLVPIRDEGVHRLRRGSEKAAELFLKILRKNPEDLVARWLLNLAHQTLGTWPEGVPERFRISPEVFASEAPMPAFRDVAAAAGVAVVASSGGGVMEDFDGDGLLDLMVSSWRLAEPLHYLHNAGDGTFEDRTEEAGLEGMTGGLNLIHADYDNDGDRDVLVLRGAWRGQQGRFPNSLLRNEGNGTFTDVTESAGLLSFHPTQTAAWADFDGDGWLDLFIGNESMPGEVHPTELYLNQGDGTFRDMAGPAGAAVVGFIKGVAAGDYDGDGLPDLYLSRMGQPNVLLHNEGLADPSADGDAPRVPRFRDVTAQAGVAEPLLGFPTWFFDYDGDGDLDLFASAFGPKTLPPELRMTERRIQPQMFRHFFSLVVADHLGLPTQGDSPRLYRNRGDGTFEDATGEARLDRVLYAMGANYGDLDGDGLPDLYLGTGDPTLEALTPNRALWNAGDGTFRDVTTASRLGHVQKGHGVSFGDVDNDGDQDVHVVLGGAFEGDVYANALFENPSPPGPWIKLDLEGTTSSRDALGARVAVEVEDADGRVRTIYSFVSSGGSFGASPLRREIGLGRAVKVRSVEVRWPSGQVQTFQGLEMGKFYRLVQGEQDPQERALPRIQLPGSHATPSSAPSISD